MSLVADEERASNNDLAVKVDSLSMKYGNVVAVDDVSFEIPVGTCVGLIGPNGAGKTTIIKALIGQRWPSKGTIEVFGSNVRRQRNEARRRIGVVPQENNLYGDITVNDNLILHSYLFGVSRKARKARIEQLMSLAGLEGKGGTLVRDLSGGMKRKLTLIRSLLHDPDLLFLDELTTGLDPESRREFWDYIENLKAQGKTILLTTHYIEEASQLADDIILIHQGKLIERGPPTELRRKHVGLATITLSADPMQLQRALPDTDVKQLSDGKLRVTIGSLEDIPGIMDAIHSNHVAYDHLEVKLTTLEEVFLRLTGRRIRE